jgi:hypothetical protein
VKNLHLSRRGRAAPVHWEWYCNPGTGRARACYLMAGIAHRHRHAWWAFTLYLYLPPWVAATPLARVPSTGWRSWRDSWAPLRPWRGGSRPWARLAARRGGDLT